MLSRLSIMISIDFDRFDLTLRNSTARRRDLKRPSYTKFLEFAKNLDIQNNLENKEFYLDSHFKNFPEFKKAYNEELIKQYYRNQYRKKFSGDLVMAVTGLKGKELGIFMKSIKDEFSQEYVLRVSDLEIMRKIKQLFEKGD